MSHSIVIIDECLNAMMGDASSGTIFELKDAVDKLDSELPLADPGDNEDAHELLEGIQAWACDGGEYNLGAAAQADHFRDKCIDLTP